MLKFATVLLLQIMCGMEMDLFIPSFPELQRMFQLSAAEVQLTVSVNFIALCVCALFTGALGDRYNRRWILLIGLVIFVIGSLFCVSAANFPLLLLGRLLQGIGIAGPHILSFPVLLEEVKKEDQATIMGWINAVKTLAMALAPLLGSWVNLYFNWRGNFALLLILGISSLIASYCTFPAKAGNEKVSLSLKAYLPLLKCIPYMQLNAGFCLLIAGFWTFMGMAPILYMEGLGVELKHFGYYQGALSLTFAIVCIISNKLYQYWGQQRCLYVGMGMCLFSLLLIMMLIKFAIEQPLLLTGTGIVLAAGIVFPINILYPCLLNIVASHQQSRAAGLGQAMLLVATAFLLEMAGYFYDGHFTTLGIIMIGTISSGLALIIPMLLKKAICIPSA